MRYSWRYERSRGVGLRGRAGALEELAQGSSSMGRLVPISYDEEGRERSEKNRRQRRKTNSDFNPSGKSHIWRFFIACSIWIDTRFQRRIKDG